VARIRYLTDEHVPSAVAKGLRARGVEVTTAVQAGTLHTPDPSVITHARERGWVPPAVFTGHPVGWLHAPNEAYGALRAFDPLTGERKWEFKRDKSDVLTTATDLLFAGVGDGYFYALNASTSQVLWQAPVAGRVYSGPMSYAVIGKQYVTVAAGNILYASALRP